MLQIFYQLFMRPFTTRLGAIFICSGHGKTSVYRFGLERDFKIGLTPFDNRH